jgi:hypothetical protein
MKGWKDPGGPKTYGSVTQVCRSSALNIIIYLFLLKIFAGIALNATAKEFVPSTAEGEFIGNYCEDVSAHFLHLFFPKKITKNLCFGSGSVLDSDSIRSVEPYPDLESGSGSTRAKMTHKNRKKLRNFMF